jgi:toxin ParE1/3/4
VQRVSWSLPAHADLKRIETWLASERPPAFELATLQAIHARCLFLAKFPHGGGILMGELRRLVVIGTPYIMIFRVQDSGIEIVRLFHERQDWQFEL